MSTRLGHRPDRRKSATTSLPWPPNSPIPGVRNTAPGAALEQNAQNDEGTYAHRNSSHQCSAAEPVTPVTPKDLPPCPACEQRREAQPEVVRTSELIITFAAGRTVRPPATGGGSLSGKRQPPAALVAALLAAGRPVAAATWSAVEFVKLFGLINRQSLRAIAALGKG